MEENKPAEKHYTNGEITVVWKPDSCIHSKNCWHGLLDVFDPRKRPWIKMQGASTEAIKAQITKCPSGALSWFDNQAYPKKTEPTSTEDPQLVIEVLNNGPLKVHGSIRVKDSQGNEVLKENTCFLCRCGASSKKPYCDGSHRNIDFIG